MSDVRMSAEISPCGLYRYSLQRSWGCGFVLPFVMLNPSTADANTDDPTIRRCIGFAKREGFSGIIVGNLYAFRATSPADLWKSTDPYGPGNNDALRKIAHYSGYHQVPLICGWGAQGGKSNHGVHLMQQAGADLRCLGKTKSGNPRHPLYVRSNQPFEALHGP